MVTVVAIFAVLVLALWLCAVLAIGILLVSWGAPAAAAFAAFVYMDRLGLETPIAGASALGVFILVRIVVVRLATALIYLLGARLPPRTAFAH